MSRLAQASAASRPVVDGWPGVERRGGGDRRRDRLGSVRGWWAPRRRHLRRASDRSGRLRVVDWYPPRLLALTIAIFVLSALDAVLTLRLIAAGITTEANPIMDYLLGVHVDAFVVTKVVVTGFGLVALVAFSNLVAFGRIRMASVMVWVLVFYLALVGYELILLRYGA